MRTKLRTNKFMRVVFMSLSVAVLSVGCGKKNTSGGSSSSSNYGYAGISTAGVNGMSLPSNWLDIVRRENPCYQSGQSRQRVVIPVTGVNVNAGAFYVGVTAEGDVAVVSNQNSGAVIEMFLCQRSDTTGQGQVDPNVALNTSYNCPVGEVSKVDVYLSSQYGNPYVLKFFPIAINGTNQQSSICQSSGYSNQNYQNQYPNQYPY